MVPLFYECYASFKGGSLVCVPYYQNGTYNMWSDIDNYKIRFNNSWGEVTIDKVYITIKYTKTLTTEE